MTGFIGRIWYSLQGPKPSISMPRAMAETAGRLGSARAVHQVPLRDPDVAVSGSSGFLLGGSRNQVFRETGSRSHQFSKG